MTTFLPAGLSNKLRKFDRVPPRGVSAALLGSVELPVRLPMLAS